jgi:hypothetical protein
MPFSNPAADLGWDRPLPAKWKASPRSHFPNAKVAWRLLAVLAAIFLTANFAVLPLMHIFRQRDWGAVWVYTCAGLMLAQAGVLSIGVVFWPAGWLYRMGTFWAAAMVLFAGWGAGYLAYYWMRTLPLRMEREIYVALMSLPLLALVVQAPLWGLKLFAGWSLVRPTETGNKTPERPLSISDYLAGMAVIAASLAIARLAPHNTGQEFWAGWSVVSASVFTLSLASIPPAILFVLRWPGGMAGVPTMMVYTAAAALLALAIFWAIEASIRVRLGGPSAWELFGYFLVLESFAVGMSTALLAMRYLGFRLLLSRNAEPIPPATP